MGIDLKSPYLKIAFWWVCVALAVIIPTFKIYSSLLIALLGLVALLAMKPRWPLSKTMLGFALMYGLILLGVPFSDHPEGLHAALESKLSFLVFPIIWIFKPAYDEKWVQRILAFFIGAVTIFACYAWVKAGLDFRSSGDLGVFSYSRLSSPFHPSYMAAYACFSIGILLQWLEKGEVKQSSLGFVSIIFLVVYVAVLSSRAGILTLVLLLIFYLVRWVKNRQGRFEVLALTAVASVFVLSILLSPRTLKRVESAVNDTVEERVEPFAKSSGNVRFVTWKTALELLLEHPFGVGTGDVKMELNKSYVDQGERFAADHHLNAHNQFLQAAVEHGWVGLLLLLLTGLWGFREAIAAKSEAQILLLLIVGFNMLFESFLELQAGIVFFSFFVMLFNRRTEVSRTEAVI